jgi:hypothetical protein
METMEERAITTTVPGMILPIGRRMKLRPRRKIESPAKSVVDTMKDWCAEVAIKPDDYCSIWLYRMPTLCFLKYGSEYQGVLTLPTHVDRNAVRGAIKKRLHKLGHKIDRLPVDIVISRVAWETKPDRVDAVRRWAEVHLHKHGDSFTKMLRLREVNMRLANCWVTPTTLTL